MMEKKNKTATAVIMILIAAAGWGIIGVFSRPLAGIGLNAIQITWLRSMIVAVGMALLLLFRNRSLFRIKLKDLWMFFGTGLLSIVFFNVCYFITIEHTTLAAASILLYTAPCFVMLMSACFFRERITGQKVAALVLAFAGCVLVSGFMGGEITVFAFLTGVGSGFGYALYSIFGKVALKRYHAFTVIFYTFVVASAGLMPFADLPDIVSMLAGGRNGIGAGLGLGVISTLIPFIFYTTGLNHVEAGKASVLAFAEPMVAAIAGIMLYQELLQFKNALGIFLIFFAIVLLNIPLGSLLQRFRTKNTDQPL